LAHYVIRVARNAGIIALFVFVAVLGILSGVLFAYAGDLPQISTLDHYSPNTITRVYAGGGELIGEFAVQRRLVVSYDDIAPQLRQAIIASEDGGFERHIGLSISAIAMRLASDVVRAVDDKIRGRSSRPKGASTITQQLARDLFPQAVGFQIGDISLERKIKEAIVAMEIEKRYTKREIFTFYANQVLFGHGTYGVESAARLYFGKSAKDLTLEEAALLAGIIQNPARQSPYVNLEAAQSRRNYVLQRMADEGDISQAVADQTKLQPIVTRGEPTTPPGIAPYFVEEVRKHLEKEYGAKTLYENGLSVQTTLDVDMQRDANKALAAGLRALDKRHGYRKPARNVIAEHHTVDGFATDRWNRPMLPGDIVPAVVASIGKPAPAGGARLHIGRLHADLTKDGFSWTRRAAAADLFKPGDLIEVQITKVDEASDTATVSLEQTPTVQGAALAIDNRTGQIKAMVGGWDFSRSKFNRAVQAYRQMGSTFKPVVYTTAIDRGYTPSTLILDAPVSYNAGAGQPLYTPKNFDGKFEGSITLRRALEDSRNIPAIKMMDMLGPPHVLEYAKKLGFPEHFAPYLSTALGAGEATLLEVTSAYTTFPNQGVRMTPYDITKVLDREGNLLEEGRGEPVDSIRADTAFVMTNLLRGVVLRGTAEADRDIPWPIAGKTGTVDDNTDAWFIGFDPDVTIGVWVGFDEKKSMGSLEQGAIAALPIWTDIMKGHIARHADTDDVPSFEAPGNIVFLATDKANGAEVPEGTPGAIVEAFVSGTQPGGIGR
jgi:penicillin-binding protein 1A